MGTEGALREGEDAVADAEEVRVGVEAGALGDGSATDELVDLLDVVHSRLVEEEALGRMPDLPVSTIGIGTGSAVVHVDGTCVLNSAVCLLGHEAAGDLGDEFRFSRQVRYSP
jgi:hypothetical protein